MASLRRLAWMCRKLAKQHVDDPDVPAAPDGAGGYAKWVQIALILYRVELEKSLRERHCLVLDCLRWRSSVERLVRSIVVVVVSEAS